MNTSGASSSKSSLGSQDHLITSRERKGRQAQGRGYNPSACVQGSERSLQSSEGCLRSSERSFQSSEGCLQSSERSLQSSERCVAGSQAWRQERVQRDGTESRFLFDVPKARSDRQRVIGNKPRNRSDRDYYDVPSRVSVNVRGEKKSSASGSIKLGFVVRRNDSGGTCNASRKMKPGSEGLVRQEGAVIVGSNILSSNFYREEALTARAEQAVEAYYPSLEANAEQAVEAYYPSLSADYPILLSGLNNHRANRDRHSHYRLKVATWKEENKTPSFFSNINLSINIKNTSKEKILEKLELMKTENSLYFEETLFGEYIEKGSTGNYWSNGLLIKIIKELISLYRTKKRDQSGMEEMKSKLIGLIRYVFESFDFEDKVGQGVLLALGYAVEEPRVFELVLTQLLKQLYVEDQINQIGRNDRPGLLEFIAKKDINFLLKEEAVKEIFKRYMKEKLPKCGIAGGGDTSRYFKGDNIFCHVLMSMRVVGLEEVVLGVEEVLGEEEERNRYREYKNILRILSNVGFGVEDLGALEYDVWNAQTGKEKLHGWMLLEKVMGEQVWAFLNPSNSEGCNFLKGIVMSFLYEVEDSIRSEKEYQDFFIKASVDKNGYSLLDLHQMNCYVIQCKNKNLFLDEALTRAIEESIVAGDSKEEGRNAVGLELSSKKLGQGSERVSEAQSSASVVIEAMASKAIDKNSKEELREELREVLREDCIEGFTEVGRDRRREVRIENSREELTESRIEVSREIPRDTKGEACREASAVIAWEEREEELTGANSKKGIKLLLKPGLQEELMSLLILYLKKCCEADLVNQEDVETIGECLKYLIGILGIQDRTYFETLYTKGHVGLWFFCLREIERAEDDAGSKKIDGAEDDLGSEPIDGVVGDVGSRPIGKVQGDLRSKMLGQANKVICGISKDLDKKNSSNRTKEAQKVHDCAGTKGGSLLEDLIIADRDNKVVDFSNRIRDRRGILNDILLDWHQCDGVKLFLKEDEIPQQNSKGNRAKSKALRKKESNKKGLAECSSWKALQQKVLPPEQLEEMLKAMLKKEEFYQKKYLFKQDREGLQNGIEGQEGRILKYLWSLEGGIKGEGLKKMVSVLFSEAVEVEKLEVESSRWSSLDLWKALFSELSFPRFKKLLLKKEGKREGEEGTLLILKGLREVLLRNRKEVAQGKKDWNQFFKNIFIKDLGILKEVLLAWTGNASKEEVLAFSSFLKDLGEGDWLEGFEAMEVILKYYEGVDWDDGENVLIPEEERDVLWGIKMLLPKTCHKKINYDAFECFLCSFPESIITQVGDFFGQSIDEGMVTGFNVTEIMNKALKRRAELDEKDLKALHDAVELSSIQDITTYIRKLNKENQLKALHHEVMVGNVYGINEPLNVAEHAFIRYIDAVSSGIGENSVQGSIVNLLLGKYVTTESKVALLLKFAPYSTIFLMGYDYLSKIYKQIIQSSQADPENIKLLIISVIEKIDIGEEKNDPYWKIFLDLHKQAISLNVSCEECLTNKLIIYIDKNFSQKKLYSMLSFLNKELLYDSFHRVIQYFWSKTSYPIKLWIVSTASTISNNKAEVFFNFFDPLIEFTKDEDWNQQVISIIDLVNQQKKGISIDHPNIPEIHYSEKRIFIDRAIFVLEIGITCLLNNEVFSETNNIVTGQDLIRIFEKLWEKEIKLSSEVKKDWLGDYATLAIGVVRIASKFPSYDFRFLSSNLITIVWDKIGFLSEIVVFSCALKGCIENDLENHYQIWFDKLVGFVKDLSSLKKNVAVIACMKEFFPSRANEVESIVERKALPSDVAAVESIVDLARLEARLDEYVSRIAEWNQLIFLKKIKIEVPCCQKHSTKSNKMDRLACYASLYGFSTMDCGAKDWFFKILKKSIFLLKEEDVIGTMENIFFLILEKEKDNAKETIQDYLKIIVSYLEDKKVTIINKWLYLFDLFFNRVEEKPIKSMIQHFFHEFLKKFIKEWGESKCVLRELMFLYKVYHFRVNRWIELNSLKELFKLFIEKSRKSNNSFSEELLCAVFFHRVLQVEAKDIEACSFYEEITSYINTYKGFYKACQLDEDFHPVGQLLVEYFLININNIINILSKKYTDDVLYSILINIPCKQQVKIQKEYLDDLCKNLVIIRLEQSWIRMIRVSLLESEWGMLKRFISATLSLEDFHSTSDNLKSNLLFGWYSCVLQYSKQSDFYSCLEIFVLLLEASIDFPVACFKYYYDAAFHLLNCIEKIYQAKKISEHIPLYLMKKYSFILNQEQKKSLLMKVFSILISQKNFTFQEALKWFFVFFDAVMLGEAMQSGKTFTEVFLECYLQGLVEVTQSEKTSQKIDLLWDYQDINSRTLLDSFEKFFQKLYQCSSADEAYGILKNYFWQKTPKQQLGSTTVAYHPPVSGVFFSLVEMIYMKFAVNELWIIDQLCLSWKEIMLREADSVYGLYDFYIKKNLPIHCLLLMISTEEASRSRHKELILLKEMLRKFDITTQVCDPLLEMLCKDSYKKTFEEKLLFFLEITYKFFEIFKNHLDCFQEGGLSILLNKMGRLVDVYVNNSDSDCILQKRELYQKIFAHPLSSKILFLFSNTKNISTINSETVVAFMSVIPEDFSCIHSFEGLIKIALNTEDFFVSPEADMSRVPKCLDGRDDLKVLSLPCLGSIVQHGTSLRREDLEEIVTVSRGDFAWVSLLWIAKRNPSIFFEILNYAQDQEIPCFKNGTIYSCFIIKEFLEDWREDPALKKDGCLHNRMETLKKNYREVLALETSS